MWALKTLYDFLVLPRCLLSESMRKQRAVRRILSFPWCYINSSGFPGGSDSKDSACNVGDLNLIPGLGRSPGEGKGCPLQYSGLENSIDCIVHRVTKSQTRLGDFHFHFMTLTAGKNSFSAGFLLFQFIFY